jgi:hypothetical protein
MTRAAQNRAASSYDERLALARDGYHLTAEGAR